MSKLYVFAIGGTGARVLRSLTMLLAAGVDCGVNTIVPIIIDRDLSNKDLARTKLLIEDYILVNKSVDLNGKNKFFRTKISLLGGELCLQLQDKTQKFEDFIGKSSMTYENQALVDMLFSEKTLTLDMAAGFQGNPNIGSVVLNQFDDSDIFKAFANDFKQGDKVFIISSIFGGTGASGFPLLRKILQTPNVKDVNGYNLPNWGLVNKAPIGAISVLPYFIVGQAKDDSQVDSDTFVDKTRAALSYYKNEDKKIDTLYYAADRLSTTYEHNKGGDKQKNNAHFVELIGALALLDFANPLNDKNVERGNGIDKRTIYKEFAINADLKEINFSGFADDTKRLIINPLSRFLLFAKYMGYIVAQKVANGEKELVVEKNNSTDIFNKEHKHQPYARKKFRGDFRMMDPIQKLESIQMKYVEWLVEMENQERKFSPFNLETSNCNDFINGALNVSMPKELPYKNWAKVDNELNAQKGKIDKAMKNDACFIELFYRVSEKLINYKN